MESVPGTTEFHASLLRSLALLAVALAFTAGGTWLVTRDEPCEVVGIALGAGTCRGAGIAALGLFGLLGIPAAVYMAARRPVMVRLTDTGVELHQRPFVPWEEIRDVEARTVAGARMVVLWLQEGAVERLTAGRPPGASAMRSDTRMLGADALATAPGVAGGPRRLAGEIRDHLSRAHGGAPPGSD